MNYAVAICNSPSQLSVVKSKRKPAPAVIGQRRAPCRDLVVLCRTCGGKRGGGKRGGGFGEDGKHELRSVLRKALRAAGDGGGVRIIETGCLGVCPKRAVVAFRGNDPGRLLIVPRGSATPDVLAALGLMAPE